MPTVSQHYNLTTGDVSALASDDSMRAAAPVVLMVSGGADSTALLLMACSSRLDIADGRGCVPIARERLHVLHVNHHLRGEASDGDEMFVRDLCERFGLPLCVEHASFECLEGQRGRFATRRLSATCVSFAERLVSPVLPLVFLRRTRRAIVPRPFS